MGFMTFCRWLGDTAFSRHLREAPYDFPILIIIHILTIALFGGVVAMGSLRVLGWALKSVPVSQVIGRFRAWKWTAFGLLLVSGGLLAASDPVEYGGNVMFWVSNLLLLAVGLNAMVFRFGAYRRVKEWDTALEPPAGAKRWAGISLALWIILIFAGRAIAFF